VRVRLPSPLDSYTGGLREVDLPGEDLAAVLAALDARFPGVRFRIVDERGLVRRHINVFVNEDLVTDLGRRLASGDQVMIVAALSGG
jgi:molybdopterin converting factor small subunit